MSFPRCYPLYACAYHGISMTVKAPSLSFSPTSLDFGSVEIGYSSAKKSFLVYNASKSGSTYATAREVSIGFLPSYNSDEAESGAWVWVSTALESCSIRQWPYNYPQCMGESIPQGASRPVRTKIKIPSEAQTMGEVYFQYGVYYQYIG